MKKTAPKRAVFKNQCPKSYRVCPLVNRDKSASKKGAKGKFNSLQICPF